MSGPVIILTGASRGIGRAVAEYLLKDESAPRLFLAARTTEPLEELQRSYKDRISYLQADFSVPGIGSKIVQQAIKDFGRIDALCVVHATLEPVARLENADSDQWRSGFETNLFSAVELVKAAIPDLRRSKGRVVFVSSGAAETPYLAWGAYGGTKAAMNHLAMTLGAEEPDITSISIRPGVIDTKMQDDIRDKHGVEMGSGHARFVEFKAQSKLLRPDQPGNVIARLSLAADKELSGKFLSWNSQELAAYQDN